MKGSLYLIPVFLGEEGSLDTLPPINIAIIKTIRVFIVENLRTARRFLKKVDRDIDIDQLSFFELNEHTKPEELGKFIGIMSEGNIGLMSEAGVPCVADPGSAIVRLAHAQQMRVVPLTGSSSIILSLMASGLNGQNFAFNGYLPVKSDERSKKIRFFEKRVVAEKQTQVFIETPYRNIQLFSDFLSSCEPNTLLCIACDLTLPSEYIETKTISQWRNHKPDINKRPTIFLLGN